MIWIEKFTRETMTLVPYSISSIGIELFTFSIFPMPNLEIYIFKKFTYFTQTFNLLE